VRRPIRPDIRADIAALRADHTTAQGAHRQVIGETISTQHCVVMASHRAAIYEQIATAMAANMARRNASDGFAPAESKADAASERPKPRGFKRLFTFAQILVAWPFFRGRRGTWRSRRKAWLPLGEEAG
jgi:hypothetical protein